MIIINGELHYCYRSAHAKDLGLIPDHPGDYVDLLSGDIATVRRRINEFIELDSIAACDYCNGAGKPIDLPRGAQQKSSQKTQKLSYVEKTW